MTREMALLSQLPIFEDLLPRLTGVGHDCPYTLALGAFMLQAVFFGSLAACVAVHKGLRAGRWFAAGFFLSVIGVGLAMSRGRAALRFRPPMFGKTPTTYAPVRCAGCGADQHPTAARCARCGATMLPNPPVSDVGRLRHA